MNRIFNYKNFSLFLTLVFCALLASCGGGGGSGGTSSGNSGGTGGGSGGGSSGGGNTTRTGINVVPVSVDGAIFNIVDEPFVTITICSTTNTANCMTIDHILVDTGSVGLRIFSQPSATESLSSLSLAPATISGNQVGECLQFVQGNTWGPIMLANLTIGGESASNVAFQVINDASFATAPAACTGSGSLMSTPSDFGAKGVLGIGMYLQDCGDACTPANNGASQNIYFSCGSGICTSIGMLLNSQVQNPVSTFNKDNNGVILSFNALSAAGLRTAAGTLTFGIETETNNASINPNTIQVDSYGNFKTVFNGQTYLASYIDSGSNGVFFNAPANSIPLCSGTAASFYCPTSNQNLTAQIFAQPNGTAAVSVAFNIGNATSLFNSGNFALNNLAGTAADIPGQGKTFDWGLPFFFGRDVYVAIEGNITSKGTGPYVGF